MIFTLYQNKSSIDTQSVMRYFLRHGGVVLGVAAPRAQPQIRADNGRHEAAEEEHGEPEVHEAARACVGLQYVPVYLLLKYCVKLLAGPIK